MSDFEMIIKIYLSEERSFTFGTLIIRLVQMLVKMRGNKGSLTGGCAPGTEMALFEVVIMQPEVLLQFVVVAATGFGVYRKYGTYLSKL